MSVNKLKSVWQTRQIGVFAGIGHAYTTEILATAGFDFILIDGEHGPNTLPTVMSQLQALSGISTGIMLRIPDHDPIKLKQYLDIGVQNFLVPMVESVEHAYAIVQATRYPPHGNRGVGTAMARAALWNADDHYLKTANQNIGLMLQIETVKGVDNIDAILNVSGVDGIFIGPADLAASMGYLGQPTHPEVQSVIASILPKIRAVGKIAGIFSANIDQTRIYEELGAQFLVVGVDTLILRIGALNLRYQFNSDMQEGQLPVGMAY